MHGGFTTEESVTKYADIVERGLFDHEASAISHFGPPPARILDLGCGAGRTTRPLAAAGFDVVGLDLSRGMVGAASELIPEAEYVHASATDLPFDPGSFDHALFAFNGLDYIPTEDGRRAALEEIHRVLVPDGRFVFCSHNPRYVVGTDPYNPFSYVHLIRFWLLNLAAGRLTSRYKLDLTEEGLTETHFVTPGEQRDQLRAVGFEPLGTLSRYRTDALAAVDPWPYYVAAKR